MHWREWIILGFFFGILLKFLLKMFRINKPLPEVDSPVAEAAIAEDITSTNAIGNVELRGTSGNGQRPGVEGIFKTSLYVSELERSIRFYIRIFGFEVIEAGKRHCMLVVSDRQALVFYKKGASPELALGAHDGGGKLHLAFAVLQAELAAWEIWLEQQGVVIEHRRVWERGGHSLYFRDPDQHLIELATHALWTFD